MTWSPRRRAPEQPPPIASDISAPLTADPAPTKTCPKCAEHVLTNAEVCRYCKHEFRRQRHWYDGWKWAAAVVGLVVGIAYFTGGLDATLSGLGLNTRTCAKNLFGNTMCGDELVQFCKDHYDPSANANTCDPVLADAGIDAGAIAAEQKTARRDYDRCIQREIASSDGSAANCEVP